MTPGLGPPLPLPGKASFLRPASYSFLVYLAVDEEGTGKGAACKLSKGEGTLGHIALSTQATTGRIFPDVCVVLRFPNLSN